MSNTNLSLQILPVVAEEEIYGVVDQVIQLIQLTFSLFSLFELAPDHPPLPPPSTRARSNR